MNASPKMLATRFALALGLLAVAVPAAAATGSYGYVRVVEGSATVMQAGTTERSSAEINQPVLAGDRLWVPDRSHLEIVLADRNVLRVDGGSELVLERLAGSPDRDDRATVLRLLEGNVQLVVFQDSLGDELPRVETPNATIYPRDYGVYRITADREGWSQLVVRRGSAEVRTDRGAESVRADEEAVIDGSRAEVREASGVDPLERWARRLDDESASETADLRYVDDNLRYQASSLNRYGDWVYADGSPYWRPRVAAGWRPYWQGRWVYTPVGLTWVSSEPWGWVPYHYGSWDYLPAYGWVWQPGYVWSPAWVYWYWGPSYVGWCPTGYYTRFYGPRFGFNFGFRFGVYGWAGGDFGLFHHWSFVHHSYFAGYRDGYRQGYRDGFWDGHRDVHRFAVAVDGASPGRTLERGIITTDTKPLRPSTWTKPLDLAQLTPGRSAHELPDVTSFVARKPELSPTVARTVRADGNTATLDGTPLKPSSLGRDGRDSREGRGRRVEIGGAEPGGRGNEIRGNGGIDNRGVVDGRGTIGEKPTARSGRPAPEADGGAPRPRIVIEKPGGAGDSRGEVRGGEPRAREGSREGFGRPAPETDGGAPRPSRRVEVEGAKPETSGEPSVRRERVGRPEPDADGGAPRPDRGARGSEKPQFLPPPRDEGRDLGNSGRNERPRDDFHARPEPPARQDRTGGQEPSQRWVRPEPQERPQEMKPYYRAPEPSRQPEPPRYEGGDRGDRGNRGGETRSAPPPQRSRGNEGERSQERERHAKPRDNG